MNVKPGDIARITTDTTDKNNGRIVLVQERYFPGTSGRFSNEFIWWTVETLQPAWSISEDKSKVLREAGYAAICPDNNLRRVEDLDDSEVSPRDESVRVRNDRSP